MLIIEIILFFSRSDTKYIYISCIYGHLHRYFCYNGDSDFNFVQVTVKLNKISIIMKWKEEHDQLKRRLGYFTGLKPSKSLSRKKPVIISKLLSKFYPLSLISSRKEGSCIKYRVMNFFWCPITFDTNALLKDIHCN